MRVFVVAGALALLMTACASPPVRDPAVLALDGNFAGPVVADRFVPDSVAYERMCESRAYRWDRGWYRVYGPCERAAPYLYRQTTIVRKG
jgi:hypothetical protein